jgi:hypothetical protein
MSSRTQKLCFSSHAVEFLAPRRANFEVLLMSNAFCAVFWRPKSQFDEHSCGGFWTETEFKRNHRGKLVEHIEEMLTNDKHSQQAKETAAILNDNPIKPMDRVRHHQTQGNEASNI